jgi:Tfp pilus assembly protein PilX
MKNKQKGSSLLFTLIVLVAMLFGTIALFRSTTNSTVVAGNLAFKEATVNASDIAVKKAFAQLKTIADLDTDVAVDSSVIGAYYAVQRKISTDGIVCSTLAYTDTDTCNNSAMSWGQGFSVGVKGTDTAYYVIDRLCNVASPGSNANASCLVDTPYVPECHLADNSACPKAPPAISYRITVKVVGANNTESYVQVTMSQS